MDIAAELRELARNMWWSWHPHAVALFRDLDSDLWRQVNHSPIALLNRMPPERLVRRAAELALEARINYALHRQHEYLHARRNWGDTYAGPLRAHPVAYFSAEFGLHESIPVYSGGLGTLAGDHLKSASDLGVPIVGVGLLYAQGYFNQRLDAQGWQQESYLETETGQLPVEEVRMAGEPLRVAVDTQKSKVLLRVWRLPVGCATLLLLDSDVEDNPEAQRGLTGRLYGGDANVRIRQELILGVGGMRALAALGIRPGVLHLNEGHSAFAVLEMTRQEMTADSIDFQTAFRRVRARTAFTTHTPVEAGHDRFGEEVVEEALAPLRQALNLSTDDLMALGRVNTGDRREPFCMTVLGLKASWKTNAVSALHGRISRRMWQGLWPDRAEHEVPIRHVTNGVHTLSWLADPMREIFDTYLGADWERRMSRPEAWRSAADIDDAELWEAHEILKSRLVSYVQRQVCAQEAERGETGEACDLTAKRLDPSVLTVGLARRFATYKRHNLILADERRLEQLVSDTKRPLQVIFAGKAHPRDDPGKHLIQRIFRMSRDPRFLGRVIFLEDYDMNVARHLTQGVDVWLNNPRRPREASGTSGMKAICNGVLNLSIVDGWWAEAYDGQNGFAIGTGGEHADDKEQDRRDAEALYDVLEGAIIPLYYERDDHGIPLGWIARVKHAIQSLAWRFNADRMVIEYARRCYLPSVGAGSSVPGFDDA